jgi:hypothetical protein
LLFFRCHQVDAKEIKCHLQWWGKYEAMFSIVGFLLSQILGIIGSQIEIPFFSMHIYKHKEMFTSKKKI